MVDTASGALVVDLQAHEGAVWSLAVRPDGKGFVTASADKEVKFWDFTVRTYVSVCVRVMCMFVYACMCVLLHVPTYVFIRECTCVRMHVFIYIEVNTTARMLLTLIQCFELWQLSNVHLCIS